MTTEQKAKWYQDLKTLYGEEEADRIIRIDDYFEQKAKEKKEFRELYLSSLKSRYKNGEKIGFSIDTFYSDKHMSCPKNAVRSSDYYSEDEMDTLLRGEEIEIFPDDWESINTDMDDE